MGHHFKYHQGPHKVGILANQTARVPGR